MKNEELYQNIIKKYNIKKLGIKEYELFEIANKYVLYKKSAKRQYLKPIYELVCFLTMFIAKIESENALENKK